MLPVRVDGGGGVSEGVLGVPYSPALSILICHVNPVLAEVVVLNDGYADARNETGQKG